MTGKREVRLSEGEKDILEKIVGYGGYVTKDILALYRRDITKDRCYRLLRQLEGKGLLRPRDYFESFRKPIVFQVTRKACNYFGRPEAYMRKIHKPYAMRRYLIRAHFLFDLAGRGMPTYLFSSVSREAFLKEKGFTTWFLPQKWNQNTARVQIEEYILEDPHFSKDNEICLLYIDDLRDTIRAQIYKLLERYKRMEKTQRVRLSYLVITETDYRASSFMTVYETYFKELSQFTSLKAQSIHYFYQSQFENYPT